MKKSTAVIWCLMILVLCASTAWSVPAPPSPARLVNDKANLLPTDSVAALEDRLRHLEQTTSIEFVVLTVPSLDGEDIESYATEVLQTWGIGKKGKDNGILLLIAPNDRLSRIETGYGLESVFTDAEASEVTREFIIPNMKARQPVAAIMTAADAIIARLQANYLAEPSAPEPPPVPIDWGAVFRVVMVVVLVGAIFSLIVMLVARHWHFRQLLKSCRTGLQIAKTKCDEATRTLMALRQQYVSTAWDKLAIEFDRLDAPHLAASLPQLSTFQLWPSATKIMQLEKLEHTIRGQIKLMDDILAQPKRIIDARVKALKLVEQLEPAGTQVQGLFRHPDVRPERIHPFAAWLPGFTGLIMQAKADARSTDWISMLGLLTEEKKHLIAFTTQANDDITLAETARREGPKLLARLPELQGTIDGRLKKYQGRARRELEAAQKKCEQAAAGGESIVDWVPLYLLLSQAQTDIEQAHSYHQSDSYTPSHTHRSDDSHSSPSFSSFGGGKGGGGGATGSW